MVVLDHLRVVPRTPGWASSDVVYHVRGVIRELEYGGMTRDHCRLTPISTGQTPEVKILMAMSDSLSRILLNVFYISKRSVSCASGRLHQIRYCAI